MVDFATALSQNRFSTCKLSPHKKTNIAVFRTWQNHFFINFIVYCRAVMKQHHYMTHLLSYGNTDMRCSHCKIHRYVAAPFLQLAFIFRPMVHIKVENIRILYLIPWSNSPSSPVGWRTWDTSLTSTLQQGSSATYSALFSAFIIGTRKLTSILPFSI